LARFVIIGSGMDATGTVTGIERRYAGGRHQPHSTRAALAALALAAACGGSPCGETEAKVTRVIDGDTIELESGVRVRYLLVDTPEMSGAVECFAESAKQFNSALVLGKTVQLGYDEQCKDDFGRSLAYVSVAGQEVNSLLVQRGYACVLFIAPDGTSRVEAFKGLELDARNARRGLWSACHPLPPACRHTGPPHLGIVRSALPPIAGSTVDSENPLGLSTIRSPSFPEARSGANQ
jgi:micrococcal nuclease